MKNARYHARYSSRGTRVVKGGGFKLLCILLRRFESCPRHLTTQDENLVGIANMGENPAPAPFNAA